MEKDKYFRVPEAATYLKTSASTLAKLRVYGGGPRYTRIGRAIRYRQSDLDHFMKRNDRTSTSEDER